jgi:hypothetical protein
MTSNIINVVNYNDYDENKAEIQSKTILELQNDIKEHQKKERAYIVKLHLKDKEIRHLENYRNDLLKKYNEKRLDHYYDIYLNPLMLNEFKALKNLIKEKDELLLAKDEELNSLQTGTNNPMFKKLVNKCKDLHKENMDLYNYTQGGTLENLRHENGLEKDQIDELMTKLKEKENIQNDLESEINELSEVGSILTKKLKELEERNNELEREYKSLKTKSKD